MRLTREDAIDGHRKMWNWIADKIEEVVKIVQGNKIHRCPKCGGAGTVTKKRNKAQYWECSDDWEYYETTCDLCDGDGYTEHEYKPKMIQDGWE